MLNPKQRQLLEYTQAHIGKLSSVREWVDSSDSVKIPIGVADDAPDRGLRSYATLGLSDFSIDLRNEAGLAIRVELVGVAREDSGSFLAGFGDCAINVAANGYQPMPGRVFPSVFDDQGSLVTTPHALIWYPFAWDADFESLALDGAEVQWLTVIPITNDEFTFIQENGAGFGGEGVERLIDLFEAQGTDVWDLTRPPVVLTRGS